MTSNLLLLLQDHERGDHVRTGTTLYSLFG